MLISKEDLKEQLIENVKTLSRKTISNATPEQVYEALTFTIRDLITDKWIETHDRYMETDCKIVYYLSMEFLMGRFLGNSLINFSLYNQVKEVLEELKIDFNLVEGSERDPGLGNGGLGRLAACFLDSLSTLNYPAYGCGIRYHYGIFEQSIVDGYQMETGDNWLESGDPWGIKRQEYSVEVKFGGHVEPQKNDDGTYTFVQKDYSSVIAVPYDYPVVGYNNNIVNTLRLWDAEAKNKFDLKSFNSGNFDKAVEDQNLAKVLSEVLYPADEFVSGKELRLKQQYFFISATLQRVLKRFFESHDDYRLIPEKIQFQLNDTHPSVAVAELMRLLVDQYNVKWEDAWDITIKTCAYTNHTIMSEALEKWPIELFSRLLPRIYMIVEEINRRFCASLIEKYGNNPDKIRKMAIIADGEIRMAHLAIAGSHSINGVAQLHTEILKTQALKDFYDLYPNRFNNKTNGITQRRWLAHCNPELAKLVDDAIGGGWITDLDKLRGVEKYANDQAFQDKFMGIKHNNKIFLSNYIKSNLGINIDPNSIFDVQVKRLHEYKRQLLNLLHIVNLYNQLKINPGLNIEPRTFIFAGKASASYHMAKQIIKLINNVADTINNDPFVSEKLKVVFMPNYRVSLAEILIPAADVSEQISTASKEASGTGNMKFMLNGALTLGTMDGANVEIFEEVGEDNIFIFGLSAEEVIQKYKANSYRPWDIYNMSHNLRMALTMLINGTFSLNNHDLFRDIYESLLNGLNGARADEYFILADFDSYAKAQVKVNGAYKNKNKWAESAIINVARSGKFSSDRTIEQYAQEIWGLEKLR
ncbi:MAG: glycogen/starch/alpha-glucan phosphorylase [Clostridiales bacterium]|nr:glycogen/starch/alpha-glucan phosphorylase [Clostridiales bacterium]